MLKQEECCDEKDCNCPCRSIKEYVGAEPEYRFICADCGHSITHKEALQDILTKTELADFLLALKGEVSVG